MNQPSIINVQQENFATYWGLLGSEHQSPYKVNVAFTELHNAFQAEQRVSQPTSPASIDFSFVVVRSGKPLIGCCLILQEQVGHSRTLGFRGIFASSEFDSSCFNATTNNVEDDVFSCLNNHLDSLMEKLKPNLVEYYDSMHCGVMSPVSHWLLAQGAMPVLCAGRLLDLRGSTEKLILEMDEACQEAITWGKNALGFKLLDSPEALDSIQALSDTPSYHQPYYEHYEQTSSSYYRSLLNSGKAYIIQAFTGKNLIASTTFLIAQDKAQYVASITHSGINTKPVLQSLIWEGVQFARSRGLSWVELISPESNANEAELAMSGFGGVEQTKFKLILRLNQ